MNSIILTNGLYCNGLLKREYDSFPMCLRRYFFRKPFELLEIIKNSKYRIDFHYFKLPEEAFSNRSMLFEWVKTIADIGEGGSVLLARFWAKHQWQAMTFSRMRQCEKC